MYLYETDYRSERINKPDILEQETDIVYFVSYNTILLGDAEIIFNL